jgi:hypothetical protein
LVEESLRAASVPTIEQVSFLIANIYRTRGGYDHVDVDRAGYRFFELFESAVKNQLKELSVGGRLTTQVQRAEINLPEISKPANRWPVVEKGRVVQIILSTVSPADAQISQIYILEVPEDCDREEEITIRRHDLKDTVEARISEILPNVSMSLEMRLSIVVKRILAEMIQELSELAVNTLKRQGYRR